MNANRIVEVSDGKSILELKLNELGSYLKCRKPLAINWFDCQGSIAQFYAIFSYCQEYKETIQEHLRASLNSGNFVFEDEFNEIIKLLSLFENGKYNISFEPNYKFEISDRWNWDLAKNYKLYTSNAVIRDESQTYHSDDKANLNFLSESYHDGYCEYFIFTQPSEVLDKKRIEFYQERINQGMRPLAIIYSGYSETKGTYADGSNWRRTYRTGNFILDGHHKLIAYRNLDKAPALLRIEKIYKSDGELNFSEKDFETDLKTKLLKCQVKHFSENCESFPHRST